MPTAPPPTLGRALRAYVDARNAALITARRTLGISATDAQALLFIAANPGVRPTNIGDHLGITSAGVTTLVDRLVERGAIRRDVDPTDRRVNRLTAVAAMDEEPWSQLSRFDDDFDSLAEQGDPEQTRAFAALLEELTSAAVAQRA